MGTPRFWTAVSLLGCAALWACSDDVGGAGETTDTGGDAGTPDVSADGGPDGGDAGDAGGEMGPQLPTLDELEAGWNILEPGGDTICSRGTPYRYLVRPGSENRLVIDYMGGGACWDEITCSVAGAIFNEDLENIEQIVTRSPQGIYDHDDPNNPFANWTHVFIPYCTGDVHWGDTVTTYGSGADEVTINHRGAVNARAALDWVQANLDDPEQIFVTGCSAGAYGSIMWAPHVIEAYPEADVIQLGDSGAGIITDTFFRDSFPSWNPFDLFPSWIPDMDPDEVDLFELDLSDLYARVANHYDDRVFSQYNSYFDENQTFYFVAMGGAGVNEWSERMRTLVADTHAKNTAGNFRSYIAPGEQHCITPFDNFYTVNADGVLLVDWIADMLAGEPVDDVICSDCDRTTGE